MLDIIFYWTGVVVCITSGLFVTGITLGIVVNFVWHKLRDTHSIASLVKIIRENKIGERRL